MLHNRNIEIQKTIDGHELLLLVLRRRLNHKQADCQARHLLSKYGDAGSVMRASREELQHLLGSSGQKTILAIEEIRRLLQALIAEKVQKRPLLEEFDDVLEYCRSHLFGEQREQFHLLMLDQGYHLIDHECMQVGTINHVAVYPREVIAQALQKQAASIILVHNHPGGDATPSQADLKTTRILAMAGSYMGISILDHIIVGNHDDFSFRKAGLLPVDERW